MNIEKHLLNLYRTFFSLLVLCCISMLTSAQETTVGLLQYSEQVVDSYTLFTPLSSENTYLIDNCGNKINEWGGLQPNNSNQAFMAEDGTLIRSTFNTFQKLSWENEVLWSFNLADLELLRHHDFHVMPNGNILFIASKIYTNAAIISKGRDPNTIGNGGGTGGFKVDGLYEIRPIGEDEAELVWSWNFFDHLVQEYSLTEENYDEIGNQPRRLDVNFNGEEGNSFDWLHCNGIDYNEALDQIIISSRSTCELYVIDHSTTTEEAASSEGGTYGFGGDFLWRWGNPLAYKKGTANDQKFWEQHDPKWIKNGYPNEGRITVYNNLYNFDFAGEQPYSNVHIIDPLATNGVYPIDVNGEFGPTDYHYTYSGEVVGNNMWSNIMSNVQAMPNGNLFIAQGTIGEMFEVTEEKDIVWIYQNPVREFIYEQGSNAQILESAVDIFIVTKYPADFEGFDNYEMTPLGVLENENEVSVVCDSIVTNVVTPVIDFQVHPNPASDFLKIETSLYKYKVTLFDVLGKPVLKKNESFDATLHLDQINAGLYFLSIETDDAISKVFKIVIN